MSNIYESHLAKEREEAKRLKEAHLTLCRDRSEIFTEYVMKDSRQRKFKNAPHHNRLHAALRKHKRLVVMWPPGYGKSRQLISTVLHFLGRNTDEHYRDDPPMFNGVYCGPNQTAAEKYVRVIRDMIVNSSEVREVWPNLIPEVGEHAQWSNKAFTVTRPPGISDPDPSLQAVGSEGKIIGARLQFGVFDDTVSFENTRTPDQREKFWEWFQSTAMTRFDDNGIIVILTNSWHPEDAPHRLIEREGWPALVEPGIDEEGNALWEAEWPKDRVLRKIEELGEIEGPRKMLHRSRDEGSMRFTPKMVHVALERGRGLDLVPRWRPSNGFETYTGVDLAISKTRRRTAGRYTGETVFTTVLRHPSKVRQILDIRAGRWDAVTIISTALEVFRAYNSIFYVENNAAQDLFVQLLKVLQPDIPVVPYTTGSEAAHPEFGLEKIGVEMQNGLWILPSDNLGRANGQLYTLIQELYDYSPNKHVGDRVRSLMFAWEGCRKHENRTVGMKLGLMNR